MQGADIRRSTTWSVDAGEWPVFVLLMVPLMRFGFASIRVGFRAGGECRALPVTFAQQKEMLRDIMRSIIKTNYGPQ